MKQRGFSLIELMVAVGIMTLINIMIFASYPEFSQKMALKRTSEEIALIVRQAQAYALGIKRTASGGDDYYGFGIHFNKNNSKSLILFTDSGLTPNKIYDAGDYSVSGCGTAGTECFQEFKIGTGDYVSELWICASFLPNNRYFGCCVSKSFFYGNDKQRRQFVLRQSNDKISKRK